MNKKILENLRKGVFIPAHPLALTKERKLDEKRQKGLTKYYIESGVGGIAVGVHTTQFEIHNPKVGLYKPVLQLAIETIKEYKLEDEIIKVAGICGKTEQATKEGEIARDMGYDAGLLNLGTFTDEKDDDILIEHTKEVSRIIPVFGFYLQPATGGRELSFSFWCKFFQIDNVIAVKVAPFDRYRTIDVIRAIVETGREKDIAVYTGNDDNIIIDLITPFKFNNKIIRIVGGLLGHWAFWTKKSVDIFNEIKEIIKENSPIPQEILTLSAAITDVNSAVFDANNKFSGCIPGINEILRRSGLLEGNWCINQDITLSPGQKEEIDRIFSEYSYLRDDEFVKKNLNKWIK
ncbi:MAG TPA: dihydrodipicolinate synthase family protein [bacterium]|nr:dihydrodipicolinate synthase family protein [bacterium]